MPTDCIRQQVFQQMAKKFLLTTCLIVISTFQNTIAQNRNLTLPTYHWAQDFLLELRLRNPNQTLFSGARPFSVHQISNVLQSQTTNTGFEKFLHQRLGDFQNGFAPKLDLNDGEPVFHLGAIASNRFGRIDGEARSVLSNRFLMGASFSPNFHVVNALHFDESLLTDPNYVGRVWNDIAVFTEQAYGIYARERFSLKFGRDFLRWGRGRDASLILSDHSRTIDHFQFQWRSKKFQFTWFAGKLDPMRVSDSVAAALGAPKAERYLTGGRVDFSFFNNKLQLGAAQTVLYGTAGGPKWFFLNPFIVYHGEILNDGLEANSMGAVDFSFFPKPGLEFYGELFIDDFQLEASVIDDLEPNEIGVILGGEIADPGNVSGMALGAEYTRVTNRTYNSPTEFDKYLHRNRSLGHFLGNDFDRWLLHGRHYFGGGLQVFLSAEFLRKGEGRIDAIFDTPWLNSTLEQGYSEPFPTGVVEKTKKFSLRLRWQPKWRVFAEVAGSYASSNNFANIENAENSGTEVSLRLWYEWHKFLKL